MLLLLWRLDNLFSFGLMESARNGLFKHILAWEETWLAHWCRKVVPSGPRVSREVSNLLWCGLLSASAAVITFSAWFVPGEWTLFVQSRLIQWVKLGLLRGSPKYDLWALVLRLHVLRHCGGSRRSYFGLRLPGLLWPKLSLRLVQVNNPSFTFFLPVFANRALILFGPLKLPDRGYRSIRS